MKIKIRKLSLKEQKNLIEINCNYAYFIDNMYKSVLNYVEKISKAHILNIIKNPSEELQLRIVSKYPWSIRFIKNPSKKVQIRSVSIKPETILCIDNPCQEVENIAPMYNLNIEDDKMIECIKYNYKNAQYINFVSEKVEDFIMSECKYAVYGINKPSKRIQLFAINEGYKDYYLHNFQLCKEALELLKDKYIFNEEYRDSVYSWVLKTTICEFLSQHNLELEPIELYKILNNYETELEQYLSYDIIDKLLEINPYDIKKYNIKEPSLLEKYKHQNNIMNTGLL